MVSGKCPELMDLMLFSSNAGKVINTLAFQRCVVLLIHYNHVIMTTIGSQITSLTVVYSTVYSDADQRKHQSPESLAFVWGIHRDRWISRTKGQLRGKCFHLMMSSWHFWWAISLLFPGNKSPVRSLVGLMTLRIASDERLLKIVPFTNSKTVLIETEFMLQCCLI